MADESVELVRRALDAFNSGDIGRILELTHPGFEVTIPPELSAEPDTYRGHNGIRRYFGSFDDAMDDIRFHGEAFTVVGDSVVFALKLTAKGRHTAIPVEQNLAAVWTVRDEKIIMIRTFLSLSDALAAAGSPQ